MSCGRCEAPCPRTSEGLCGWSVAGWNHEATIEAGNEVGEVGMSHFMEAFLGVGI